MSESGFARFTGLTGFFKTWSNRVIEFPDQGPVDDHELLSSSDVKERVPADVQQLEGV